MKSNLKLLRRFIGVAFRNPEKSFRWWVNELANKVSMEETGQPCEPPPLPECPPLPPVFCENGEGG